MRPCDPAQEGYMLVTLLCISLCRIRSYILGIGEELVLV